MNEIEKLAVSITSKDGSATDTANVTATVS